MKPEEYRTFYDNKKAQAEYDFAAREMYERIVNGAICDIGCGTGELYERTPADLQSRYTGIDIDEDNIAFCRERHPEGRWICGDAQKQPEEIWGHAHTVFSFSAEFIPIGFVELVLQRCVGQVFFFHYGPEAGGHCSTSICRVDKELWASVQPKIRALNELLWDYGYSRKAILREQCWFFSWKEHLS